MATGTEKEYKSGEMAHFTKATGEIIKTTEKAYKCMRMETQTKENGKIIELKEEENAFI